MLDLDNVEFKMETEIVLIKYTTSRDRQLCYYIIILFYFFYFFYFFYLFYLFYFIITITQC